MSDKTAPDRLWYDIGYAATAEPHGQYVSFDVHEMCSLEAPPYYRDRRDHIGGDLTEDFAHAEVWLRCGIKWDGCSDWKFCEHDRGGMLHFCSVKDLADLAELFKRLYAWAAELMPEHAKEVLG